ncbi:unnamed protein product [Cuscuta epithymum]|uniref:Uncharacterized protein n=1 Tax=Cuscuta epithymum TaxID=186058 RepID=A0AAV0EE33_9ASTE|nr:unnamed protein product [Cuscuta epithymum]
MPQRGAVCDGVIDGAPNEDSVGELRHLDGDQRLEMALIANRPVKGEELPDHFRDVVGAKNVANRNAGVDGLHKVNSGVVAGDVNVSVGIGDEPAGERREVSQGLGKR